MKNPTQAITNVLSQLSEDANALIAATSDVAGEQVVEARKRLATALERGKELYGRVREQEIDCVSATNVAMHEHPYQAIAFGVGFGILIGYLITHRCPCKRD